MKPCVAVVLGTRPEFIKLLPVIDRLREAGWCRVELLASGQHAALLQPALAASGWHGTALPPEPPRSGDPSQRLHHLAEQLRLPMSRLQPAVVLVHGDTATALAGARVAAGLGLRIAHVEAGLRTYDLAHPYPEEAYRQCISGLTWLHFAPTAAAAANLIREGVSAAQVLVTGNTIVDALGRDGRQLSPDADVCRGPLAVVTLHRRELAPALPGVLKGLCAGLEDHPQLELVIPLHPNGAITAPLCGALRGKGRVRLLPPLPHPRFLALLRRAALVITDSGGVQEEAALLGVPLVIARRVTERPEVLALGRARLAGFDAEAIRDAIRWGLALGLAPTSGANDLLGDGNASARIEEALRQALCADVR